MRHAPAALSKLIQCPSSLQSHGDESTGKHITGASANGVFGKPRRVGGDTCRERTGKKKFGEGTPLHRSYFVE